MQLQLLVVERDELIASLRKRVAYLEKQLHLADASSKYNYQRAMEAQEISFETIEALRLELHQLKTTEIPGPPI